MTLIISPEGTAAELYDQYITGVTQVLDKHAPMISCKAKQQSDEWLSDSYRMARSLRQQFVRFFLFVYLGFYVAFNTVQVISRRVVGRAEEIHIIR